MVQYVACMLAFSCFRMGPFYFILCLFLESCRLLLVKFSIYWKGCSLCPCLHYNCKTTSPPRGLLKSQICMTQGILQACLFMNPGKGSLKVKYLELSTQPHFKGDVIGYSSGTLNPSYIKWISLAWMGLCSCVESVLHGVCGVLMDSKYMVKNSTYQKIPSC